MIGKAGKVKYGFPYFTLEAESKIKRAKVADCDFRGKIILEIIE